MADAPVKPAILVKEFEAKGLKPPSEIPSFKPGDTVRVSVRIREGEKERLQDFEGVCIRRKGDGLRETFTVRRVSFGIGMERVFPLHSPRINSISVVRRGRVRRAKLYYLRERSGKSARITEARTADGVPLAVVEADRARAAAKAAALKQKQDDEAAALAAEEAARKEAEALKAQGIASESKAAEAEETAQESAPDAEAAAEETKES